MTKMNMIVVACRAFFLSLQDLVGLAKKTLKIAERVVTIMSEKKLGLVS
jgi:hypothetical protein